MIAKSMFYSDDSKIPFFTRLLGGDTQGFYKDRRVDMSYEDFVGLLKAFDTRKRPERPYRSPMVSLIWGLTRFRGREASLTLSAGGKVTHRIYLSVPHMLEMVRAGKPEDVHAYLITMEALLVNSPVAE